MRKLLSAINSRFMSHFGSGTQQAAVDPHNLTPTPGAIFRFRTTPYTKFSPTETGRYATFKVLGSDSRLVVLAVLEGIWHHPPELKDTVRTILQEHRFAHTGRPAVVGVQWDWWTPDKDLQEVALLGHLPLAKEEVVFAKRALSFEVGNVHSTLHFVNYASEGEWRWAHDHEELEAEWAKVQVEAEALRAARELRYKSRLKNLTWDQLISETPFANWSPSPPFPPEEFTREARKVIHVACEELRALGVKPKKSQVRAILKRCVHWFNEADERFDGTIETEERENICAILEEMAFVARQKSLVEEIDEWREW